MIALELGRGPFLRPVLVRAVRAAGAQARMDVSALSAVARAADAVAAAWADGPAGDPLRVAIARETGALSVAFGFPDRRAAADAQRRAGLPPVGGPGGRPTARLRRRSDPPGWDLELALG